MIVAKARALLNGAFPAANGISKRNPETGFAEPQCMKNNGSATFGDSLRQTEGRKLRLFTHYSESRSAFSFATVSPPKRSATVFFTAVFGDSSK